jgi:hypothetical protein
MLLANHQLRLNHCFRPLTPRTCKFLLRNLIKKLYLINTSVPNPIKVIDTTALFTQPRVILQIKCVTYPQIFVAEISLIFFPAIDEAGGSAIDTVVVIVSPSLELVFCSLELEPDWRTWRRKSSNHHTPLSSQSKMWW